MCYRIYGAKIGNGADRMITAFITKEITTENLLKYAKESLIQEEKCWHGSNKHKKDYSAKSVKLEDIQIKHLITEQDIYDFFGRYSGWDHAFPWGELNNEDISVSNRIKNKSLIKLNYKKWLK